MGDDHDLRHLKQLVRDQFDLSNVYFSGNQLSDTKPERTVTDLEKDDKNDEGPTQGLEKVANQKSQKKRPVISNPAPKPHHKKNKHTNRKGMRHKRTTK
jgi:hypothetical protein